MSGHRFKVHTPNLLKEIGNNNPQLWALRIPINLFRSLLVEVAQRAIELDDDQLHRLMMRLTLYEQADPESADYDAALAQRMTA